MAPPAVPDPLDGLSEKVENNPGAAFTPDVLTRLRELKHEDRSAFEGLRARLKNAGCRVTALDKVVSAEDGDAGRRRPKQAGTLLDLAADANLFHARDGTGYADLEVNGHRETWPIHSKGFRRWLTHRHFETTDRAPSSQALQSVLEVTDARAHVDAPQSDVHVRVAGHEGRLYLDLADKAWRAVEIDERGWRVVEESPVRFRRAAGMQPLPVPLAGGSVDILRPFLNVACESDFVLVVAWMLAALRDRGPYPMIVLSGEQGSAKSTFSATVRALIDPNSAPLRALPRDERDFFISANNGYLLVFDNVSRLPGWTSDTLCRLATGGGFAARQLYTDKDEVLFDAARPVVLNGIEDIVTRHDLTDRALFLTLAPIPEDRRQPESELRAEFEQVRPQIIGALLDAVSTGLRRLPETHLERLPRMADFALWATACAGALWGEGVFWRAYAGNRDEAVDSVLEANPVGSAIRSLMATRTDWEGTASDLLAALSEKVGDRVAKAKSWPASARGLSGRVRRAAAFLRKVGIDVAFEKEGHARTRIIRIVRAADSVGERTEPSKAVPDAGSKGAQARSVSLPADANRGNHRPLSARGESDSPSAADRAAKDRQQSTLHGAKVRGTEVRRPARAQRPWTESEWRQFFGERAGIAQFDGRQSHEDAEALAFESCVAEWVNQHPSPTDFGYCAACGKPRQEERTVAPFDHTWLHPSCRRHWYEDRRADAVAELEAIGIHNTAKVSKHF